MLECISMYEAIKNFHKQFLFEPKVENSNNLVKKSGFIVVGMGGSALAPKILKTWKPELDIVVRSDYGLPEMLLTELQSKLIILSSYSGNTEEVIEAFHQPKDKKLNMVAIAVGGKLLSLAKENNTPYVQLPDTGIQPRSALGLSIKAFLKIIGEEDGLESISALATTLNPLLYEEEGKALAGKIKNCIPVIYSSDRNHAIAYNWKIKFNETGKIPAFFNVFPELNHNEMTGFDAVDSTRELNDKFYFIFLKDPEDDSRISKRMEVLEKLYKDRNLKVEEVKLEERGDIWHKIFSSLVLADWVAYYTAFQYGLDPEQVPMVEEFKKLILE